MEENYDYMKPRRKLGDLDGTVQDIYSLEDGVSRKRSPGEKDRSIIDLMIEKKGLISLHDDL